MNDKRKELLEDFGEVVVYFVGYYKYKFTYEATLDDGRVLTVEYGDNDIYRDSLLAVEKVRRLLYGEYTSVIIDGEAVL